MCQSVEEAAWTFLVDATKLREVKTIESVLRVTPPSEVKVEIVPDYSRNLVKLSIRLDTLVTDEFWRDAYSNAKAVLEP